MNIDTNKKNTKIIISLLIAIIFFAGGVAYGKTSFKRGMMGGAQFGAARIGLNGQSAQRGIRGGNAVSGEVLSKDATSVTVKLANGGSKIILTASSTAVLKTSQGSIDDLATGAFITVIGTQNADGSVTAQSIQLRPAGALTTGQLR